MYVALLSCPQSLNVFMLRHKSYLVFVVICNFACITHNVGSTFYIYIYIEHAAANICKHKWCTIFFQTARCPRERGKSLREKHAILTL